MSDFMAFPIKTTNTILYCKNWRQTVAFYQQCLQLAVNFRADWFVEFRLTDTAHVSIADESKASVKSCRGAGITLTLQVEDIDETWQYLQHNGVTPGPIKEHAWGARVFYFFDPEGHRIEAWSLQEKEKSYEQ